MYRVAVLYPGALGAALGRALVDAGGAPLTLLNGRSAATRNRAIAANFEIASSIEEIASNADVVISLTTPASAVQAAKDFAAIVRRRPLGKGAGPIYLEANSVTPDLKKCISDILSTAGIACCDAAFLGPANQIGPDNIMLLSGPGSSSIAPVFEPVIEVRFVGDEIGQAASLKLSLAILTKGLPALFLESILTASRQDQRVLALELMKRLYPGILGFLQRTLPTYPEHIGRRVFELLELKAWLLTQGQNPLMTAGAAMIMQQLQSGCPRRTADAKFDDVIDEFARAYLLGAGSQFADSKTGQCEASIK